MSEPFDPYSEWLGVETLAGEPNFYELLGLHLFTEEQEEISTAADSQMARVRAIRPGDKGRYWSQLLDQLRDAKKTLTNETTKSSYDEGLREAGATVDLGTESRPGGASAASTAGSSIIAEPAPSGIGGDQPMVADGNAAAPMPQTAPAPSPVRNPMPPGFPMPPTSDPAPVATSAATIETPVTTAPTPQTPAASPALPVNPAAVVAQPTTAPVSPAQPIQQPVQQPGMPVAPMAGVPMAGGPLPGGARQGFQQAAPVAMPVAGVPAAGMAPMAGIPMAGPVLPGTDMPQSMAMPTAGGATPMPVPALPTADPTLTCEPPAAGPMFGGTNTVHLGGAATPLGQDALAQPPIEGAAAMPGIGVVAEDPKIANAKRRKQSPLIAVAALLALIMVVGVGGAYQLGWFGASGDPQLADGTTNPNGQTPNDGNGSSRRETPQPGNGNSRIIGPGDGPVRIGPGDGPIRIGPPGNGGTGGTGFPIDPVVTPPVIDPTPIPTPIPTPAPRPTPIPVPEPETDLELTAEQLAEVDASLAAAKAAMGRREFSDADTAISKAEAIATSGEALEKTQRARMLYEYLMEYWDAVSQSLVGLEGTELVLNDTRALVIEADGDGMTMRYQGRNLTFTIDTLPSKLVRLIADKWLAQDDPASDVFVGAFLAVDPKSDAREARRLWQRAIDNNVPITNLLPVLDDKY